MALNWPIKKSRKSHTAKWFLHTTGSVHVVQMLLPKQCSEGTKADTHIYLVCFWGYGWSATHVQHLSKWAYAPSSLWINQQNHLQNDYDDGGGGGDVHRGKKPKRKEMPKTNITDNFSALSLLVTFSNRTKKKKCLNQILVSRARIWLHIWYQYMLWCAKAICATHTYTHHTLLRIFRAFIPFIWTCRVVNTH